MERGPLKSGGRGELGGRGTGEGNQQGVPVGMRGHLLYCVQGKRSYLDVISRYVDIHATIGTTQQKKNKVDPSVVPGYVINHGILDSTELHKLLQVSMLMPVMPKDHYYIISGGGGGGGGGGHFIT